MVPIELSELGTEFEVDAPSGREAAIVVPKPFIDPDKDTPKQQVGSGAAAASSAS